MATSVRRLVAPEPPADLASIPLEPESSPNLVWYRITDEKHPSCLFWSRAGIHRFDSPGAKHGVCYAAETVTAAFQEIWGDRLRSKAPIDWMEFSSKTVWRIEIRPPFSVFELAGANLTTIRATLQCFTGEYSTSQSWGAALMEHPANLDALQYFGRRCGSRCIALFGEERMPRAYQTMLATTRLGPLVEWRTFFPVRSRFRIRITSLPACRPPATFDAP